MAAPVVLNSSHLELTETAIKKDDLLSWVHFYYSKNSFHRQSKYKKIARDNELLFGEPRSARRAAKWMGGARRRPWKSRKNSRKSNCGVYLRLRSNSFYQKFLKKPVPVPLGGAGRKTPQLRRLRRGKRVWGKGIAAAAFTKNAAGGQNL